MHDAYFVYKRNSAHLINEDVSVVDEAMSLLLNDSTSPMTTESVNDSCLSDDLRDLDIIPIDLKTDPGNEDFGTFTRFSSLDF